LARAPQNRKRQRSITMKCKPEYSFRLYVARGTSNSAQAVANLNALCQKYLAGRHKIEVVEVFTQQNRALADEIRMTSYLLRHAQDELRSAEAAKQAAILNVLPANIALLDPQGDMSLGQ
jgi:circadian clock protein KaiB